MKRNACMAIIAASLWLAIAGIAAADDGPMFVIGSGGSVQPMKSTTIRMAAETVQAICYSRFAEYKVDFRFENSAATQTVLLGFPFDAPGSPEDHYSPAAGFRAWQDGVLLPVSLKHGREAGRPLDFYTHTAIFPPGESTVTVSYLIAPDVPGSGPPDVWAEDGVQSPEMYRNEWISPGSYDYTLHTGAYWAGDIGTAVLRWQLSDDFIGWGVDNAIRESSILDTSDPSSMPSPQDLLWSRVQSHFRIPAPNAYEWVFHNIDPWLVDSFSPYDVGLQFRTPPLEPQDDAPNCYVTPETRSSSHLELGAFKYPASNLVDGDPSTAWAEGVPGSGIGQWVDVTFPTVRTVRELRVLPGYAKRPDLFKKYNRPKRLRFSFADGTSQTVTLQDAPTLQRFPVESATGDPVRLTILDVYRGTTRNETYISEIDFGQAGAPKFEDPGTLLASARDIPSADATPGSEQRPGSSQRAESGPPSDATATAENDRPSAPSQPLLSLAVVGLALVGVSLEFWRHL